MSKPFAVALLGLVLFVATLTVGALSGSKGAFPVAFLIGGAMMLGGIAIGLARSITGAAAAILAPGHRREIE